MRVPRCSLVFVGSRHEKSADGFKIIHLENTRRHELLTAIVSAMSKVPIDTLPVELRIKIYELGDISRITDKLHRNDHEYEYEGYADGKYEKCESVDFPWYRTILMSGILNDKDAIEIAAIQGEKPRKIMCSYIALSGNLPMIQWARSYRGEVDAAEEPPMKQIRVTRSMTREQIRVVQEKIRVAQFPWDEWTCCNAAKFGHFKLLKWLHEQGCPWDSRTFGFAAGFGNVEMLKWLYQEKCPWESWACSKAAGAGHLDVLKWLRERKFYLDASTFSSAVRSGNLEMVAWLYEQKCPWEKYKLSIAAAEKGGLTMYKWLIEHECGLMNKGTCRLAALNGQLETLKWLHEQGCPWDKDWFSSAAKGGHLETLKWLHDQGCPWNERSCAHAASNGHLDALMWLREHGCPWNGRTLHYARKSGNTAVVEWAKLNGAEEPTEDDYCDDFEPDDLSMDSFEIEEDECGGTRRVRRW